jgi:hypothetical protein
MKYFLIRDKGKTNITTFMVFLCSYCAYWIINVYYIPTDAQISGANLY